MTAFKPMHFSRRQVLQVAASAGVLGAQAFAPTHALAQTYPDRPVKLLHGWAPGGNADAISRPLAARMAELLGQGVVVDSQSGAAGTIASNSVSRARPDGYTLLLALGGHAVAGALYQKLPYRTVEDFEMVSTITYFPFVVVVRAQSEFASMQALLAAAKAKPGEVSYGSAGIGSTQHLIGELIGMTAHVNMLHIPYRGDSATLTALLAGDVASMVSPITPGLMSNIKAGKLRALAITSGDRWSGAPEIPTIAESGLPGFNVRSWAVLMAPAGTPKAIVDRLNAVTQQALETPAIRSGIIALGGDPRGSTPDEAKALVAGDLKRWTQVVADAKIPRQGE